MTTVAIPLSSRKYPGLVALVDEQDYPLVSSYTWYPDQCGDRMYATAYVRGSGRAGHQHVRMHRLIMVATPETMVDHRDEDGLNNTRDNLRLASKGENMHNVGVRRHNVSGYKGVSFHRHNGRWCARIAVAGKQMSLGCYATPEEAARAYDAGARLHHGEFARLNFPVPDLPD